jgi:FkbM family methyltransferase
MNILDVGGNIGFYTILFSRLAGDNGTVHVFEPDSMNYCHLKKNTTQLKNVILNNCAVGERSGAIGLYHSQDLNVDHQTYDSGEGRPFIKVPCVSIDDYFTNNETVDFIKIDIQGFDYFAVKGMQETIKRSNKVKIFGEFWPYGLHKAGVIPSEYLKVLKDLGFDIHFLDLTCNDDLYQKVNDKSFYLNFYGSKNHT